MTKHVAVLMGGLSNERPVSLSSGKGCAEALRAAGYQVTEVDVGYDIAERLRDLAPDVAFNALHGRFGEDGTIRGSAGCRGFSANYVAVDDDEIRLTRLEIDHSNCPAEIGDQETRVFDVIGEGFRADVEGDLLTVTRTGSDATLVYRAGEPR